MKSSITCKIDDSIDGFGINQAAFKTLGLPEGSYLERYCITVEGQKWHGFIHELSPEAENCLIISEELAEAFDINKKVKAKIETSNADPIKAIQYKRINTKKKLPKAVEGMELQLEDRCQFNGKNIEVSSSDPNAGYIREDTDWKDINPDGQNEKANIERLSGTKKASERTGFDSVIGLADAKQELYEKVLLPLKRPDLAKKYLPKPVKGAVLYGPNGVGKTHLVRALCDEADIPMVRIPSYSIPITIKWSYDEAASKKDGCIVLIDEIDGLVRSRIGSEGNPFVTTLQECMDGYDQNDGVFTIATTNFPHSLPNGLKRSGRLDMPIEVSLPDRTDRLQLFEFFLSGIKVSSEINYGKLADMTATYTGADIETVVKNAGIATLVEAQEDPKVKIIMQRLTKAIEVYKPTGARIMNLKKPSVSFDDIYGQDKLIKELKKQLDIISGSKEMKYGNLDSDAILLHGPPGTGKTFIGEAIAEYLGASFAYQAGSSFKNKYVGESERNIRDLFANARTYKPVVLFIDEVDGIGMDRDGRNSLNDQMLTQLLEQMDGIESNKEVYIIAATNKPNQLDEALLSRFRRKIHMPKPDTRQRRKVLQGLFSELPDDIMEVNFQEVAEATKDMAQRDLKTFYEEVCMKLNMKELTKVTTDDMLRLLKSTSSKPKRQTKVA